MDKAWNIINDLNERDDALFDKFQVYQMMLKEREACAKICDVVHNHYKKEWENTTDKNKLGLFYQRFKGAEICAKEIRKR